MDCPWIHETVENEKYTFAADYIRLFALYNEGGIYLDTDVEVRRSYNDLLNMPYFLGCESTTNIVEAATIGTEARALWVKDVLDHYAGRHFSLCSVSRWYFGFIRSAVKLKLCFKNFKNVADL